MMGPPSVPPIWFWFRNGSRHAGLVVEPGIGGEVVVAVATSRRLPWNWLVPEGVTKAICDDAAEGAALAFDVDTVTSATWSSSSMLGRKSSALVRMKLSWMLMPSRVTLVNVDALAVDGGVAGAGVHAGLRRQESQRAAVQHRQVDDLRFA